MTDQQSNKRKAPSRIESSLAKRLFGKTVSDSDDSEDEVIAEPAPEDSDDDYPRTDAVWNDEDDVEGEVVIDDSKKAKQLKRTTDAQGGVVSTKEYSKRLREAFVRSRTAGKEPKWMLKSNAKKTDSDSDSDAEEVVEGMTRTAMKYVEKDTRLSKGYCKARLLKDVTIGHNDKRPLTVVRFHRARPLLFTAGEGNTLRIFSVDSDVKKDHFVRSVEFKRFPITSFDIVDGGSHGFISSRMQPYMLKCDIETGQFSQLRTPRSIPKQNVGQLAISRDSKLVAIVAKGGQVHVCSLASMEHVCTYSAPRPIASLQFNPTCYDELWAITESGEVFIWRVSSPREAHSFMDEGAVKGTAMTLSRDGSYIATGSNTGIVNIYSSSSVRSSSSPSPLFTLSNIVTACSALTFNHDAQIVAAASSVMKNSLRAMHVQTGTIFTDLPARFEKVPGVSSIDFSPHSGYMAVGCSNGSTRLYEMQHFDSY